MHLHTSVLREQPGLGDAGLAQVDAVHLEARFGEEHCVAAFTLGEAQRDTTGQLCDAGTKEVVGLGAEDVGIGVVPRTVATAAADPMK